jgi:Domain of unknown function (DUF4384)
MTRKLQAGFTEQRRTVMKIAFQFGAAIITVALSSVITSAFAQSSPVVRPQAIIVNPVETQLQTSVSVDRGNNNPVYNIGERIKISVSVNADAYVYVFSIHSDGVIDLILPNRLSGGNQFLHAGETRTFPPAGANYQLTVDGPGGQDKILAVASKRQLNLNEITSFKTNQPFANVTVQGQDNLARALAVVVTPVPSTDWVTSYTQFQVRGGGFVNTPAPQPVVVAPVPQQPTVIVISPQPQQPVVVVAPAPQPNNVIYARLNLVLYPGAQLVQQNDSNRQTEISFRSNASLLELGNFYKNALESRGWTTRKAKLRNDNVKLEFRKGSDKLTLEIDREDGMYRLTIQD